MKIYNIAVLITMMYFGAAESIWPFGPSPKENWIARLHKDMMTNYSRQALPIKNLDHNLTVHLGLSLNHIDIDDALQEMEINAWAVMSWTDDFINWDKSKYGNLDRLHFDPDEIWLPDISHYNSAKDSEVKPFGHIPVLAESSGQVYWFPPTLLRSKCDFNLRYWPSDKHTCVFRLGSWSHHGEQIDLQLVTNNGTTVMLENLIDNSRWALLNSTAKREVTDIEGHDTYVEITFTFTVQRQARTHATYITQSALAVVVIVLLSYALPLHRFFSRLVLHLVGISILTSCSFVLFSTLPYNGGPVPLVVRYYSGSLILATLSLLCTVFLSSRTCDGSTTTAMSSKLVGIVQATPGLRNVFVSTPTTSPYSQLDTELAEDSESLAGVSSVSPEAAEAQQNRNHKIHQIKKVINTLLFMMFFIAFIVDYMVLRSVAY
ncbi:unnamed protein product [Meganyctiphanes norvegica]|uniref:Neurotransmitter-gated ion-channel ligand-binding domain-containing protein n=1 Tax=Meganyctiphanes norvegica TaxID=48144 RepID=A0AAV2R066_MEGNR